jgi:hypothetical protein
MDPHTHTQVLDFQAFLVGLSVFNSSGSREAKLKMAFKIQVCVYMCVYVWVCVCVYVCMCVCVYVCVFNSSGSREAKLKMAFKIQVRVLRVFMYRVFMCLCVRVFMCSCVAGSHVDVFPWSLVPFRIQDFDGDGFISKQDLIEYLKRITGSTLGQEEIEEVSRRMALKDRYRVGE